MITDDQVFAALRTFIVRVLPDGTDVFQAQQNRIPQPLGPNYVMMSTVSRNFLSSSYRFYSADSRNLARSTAAGFQLDFYGPSSADYAQRFATLFRDDYACEQFDGTGVSPLYCDDGSQMPLMNAEKQYEARWMVRAVVQINPVVSTPQQFADTLRATIVKAD